jgi:hypothetical protein
MGGWVHSTQSKWWWLPTFVPGRDTALISWQSEPAQHVVTHCHRYSRGLCAVWQHKAIHKPIQRLVASGGPPNTCMQLAMCQSLDPG